MGVFDAFQIPYSALQRDHEDVIARASDAGGHHHPRRRRPRRARRLGRPPYYMVPATTMRDRWEDGELDELLDGMSRIEFTLRFTLSTPTWTRRSSAPETSTTCATTSRRRQGPAASRPVIEAKSRLAAAASSQ